jgi:hypothetical protein
VLAWNHLPACLELPGISAWNHLNETRSDSMAASSSRDTAPAAAAATAAASAADESGDAAVPAVAAYMYPVHREPLISNWQPGAAGAGKTKTWRKGGACKTCGKEYYEWRWGLKQCEECDKAQGYERSYGDKQKEAIAGGTAGSGAAGGQESTLAVEANVAAAAAAAIASSAACAAPKAAAAAAPTAAASKVKVRSAPKGGGRGTKGKLKRHPFWWVEQA